MTDEFILESETSEWQQQENAEKFFERLKLDLALRPDNIHQGSKIGGNISEYLFLLAHTVKVVAAKELRFSRVGAIEILLEVPENPNGKEAREKLTNFIDSHPDKKDFAIKDRADFSFMENKKYHTLDMKLLTRAMREVDQLIESVDPKIELVKQVSAVLDKEYKNVQSSFLKEMDLPETWFSDHSDDKDDPVQVILEKHSVWGVKWAALVKREKDIRDLILGPNDIDRVSLIGTLPSYIVLFTIRKFGIERLIDFEIDEKVDFMTEIAKKLDA